MTTSSFLIAAGCAAVLAAGCGGKQRTVARAEPVARDDRAAHRPPSGIEVASGPMREDPAVISKVLIAAGGTAGHVVPALAVADRLKAAGARVVFVGGERAEATLVPEAGY